MRKTGIGVAVAGALANFILFLIKLYVGISSNSLSVYCDAINSLGDIFSALVALWGFHMASRLSEQQSARAQALASFVIALVIAVTGAYFAYSGLERLMYPTPVYYQRRYVLLVLLTLAVKLAMVFVYCAVGKKTPSPILKTLFLDSVLDCGMTGMTVLSFRMVRKVNYAADGVFGILMGVLICVNAVRTVKAQVKALIYE